MSIKAVYSKTVEQQVRQGLFSGKQQAAATEAAEKHEKTGKARKIHKKH